MSNRRFSDNVTLKDSRSKEFQVEIPQGAVPKSKRWKCKKTLNQGSEGACTGFAFAHEIIAEPFPLVAKMNRKIAHEIYYHAQTLDQWPGEDYSGSSVLAAAKAATSLGYYESYRWAFGIKDVVLALGHIGPVVLGIDWYQGMQTPNWRYRVTPMGKKTGGHAICCTGYNARTGYIRLHNSWGRFWGKGGDCFIHENALSLLLQTGGVACVPTKRGWNHEK